MDTSHILAGLQNQHPDMLPDISTLYHLALAATRLLELGVGEGVSTAVLLCACHETGRHLFSADIGEKEAGVRQLLRSLGLNGSFWTFIGGDPVDTGTLRAVRRAGPFDFIRLNGSSTLEGTTRGLAECHPLLRPFGVMAVSHANHAYSGRIHGPIKEFLRVHPEFRTVVDDTRGSGLIVLQKGR